jgi:hypothetical protein
MSKFFFLLWLVFFLTGVCSSEEEGLSLVSGICLVENEVYQRDLPPGKITIGLQVQTEALYKISSQGRVIHGGVFQKGFNFLALPAQDIFDKTGTHTFVLECKSGEWTAMKEIVIDIRLLPLYVVQKWGEERKKHEFTLSFFIGNQLIYATKKFASSGISFKFDLPPSEGRYDPFGLIDDIKKPATGIPIFGAVAGLYHLAKSLSPGEEKKGEDTVFQKKQQIETTFLKTNVTGDLWQWRVLILLKSRDMINDKNLSP